MNEILSSIIACNESKFEHTTWKHSRFYFSSWNSHSYHPWRWQWPRSPHWGLPKNPWLFNGEQHSDDCQARAKEIVIRFRRIVSSRETLGTCALFAEKLFQITTGTPNRCENFNFRSVNDDDWCPLGNSILCLRICFGNEMDGFSSEVVPNEIPIACFVELKSSDSIIDIIK